MEELSASHAAMVVMDRHSGGTHYPIGSSQQIPDRLARSIAENEGRILYRTSVEEIIAEGGRATGVRIEGGRTIHAEAVIADISVRALYGGLVAVENLKPQTVEWVSSLEPTPSVIAAYLGVPETLVPEDFNPNTVLIDDPEREPDNFISVSIPSLLDPNLAPEGYHCISIYTIAEAGMWPSPQDPTYGSGGYRRIKEEEGKSCSIVWRSCSPVSRTPQSRSILPVHRRSSGSPAGKRELSPDPGSARSLFPQPCRARSQISRGFFWWVIRRSSGAALRRQRRRA